MREQTSPDGLVPLTVSDLPMAIDGGSAIQGHRNKLSLASFLACGGVVLAAAGVLILFFGPRSIMVATLGELIVLHPYMLTVLGVVASSAAGYVRRSAREELHRYVAKRYLLCDEAGRPVINGGLTVNPIGGGDLEIGYFMSDAPGESVEPESSR